jgi:hypothetical protein
MEGADQPLLRTVVAELEARIADADAGVQSPLRRALHLARDAAQDPVAFALQWQKCRSTLASLDRPEGMVAEMVWAIRALARGRLDDVAHALIGDRRDGHAGAWAGMVSIRCA